jgi:hypothetical protein
MGRAVRWVLALAVLAANAPAPVAALTIGPGEGIEVPFSLTAPAAGADTLTFNLVGVAAVGVATMTVELYDGATLLATVGGVPIAGIAGFVDAGSDWTTNEAPADLTTLRDGTIDGRIRVLPDFAGGGSLTADVSPITSLLVGSGTGAAELLPIAGVLSVGEASTVPEPAFGLLLVAAASRFRRRLR